MRICSITKTPMTQGWVLNDGDLYVKHESDLISFTRENFPEGTSNHDILNELCVMDIAYWTEWSDAMVVGSLRVTSKEHQCDFSSYLWTEPTSLQEILTFIHSFNFKVKDIQFYTLNVADIYDEIIQFGVDGISETLIAENGVEYLLTLKIV
jgi:hypothetical protein